MNEEHQLLAAVERAEHSGTAAQLGNALDHLAAFFHRAERYSDAVPVYRRSLALWRPILGSEHPVIGTLLLNLGDVHHRLGELQEAEPLFKQAVLIIEGDVEFDDPGALLSLEEFVATLRSSGAREPAQLLDERVARIRARAVATVNA